MRGNLLTIAQESLPPTLAFHALYTVCLVLPVARQPTIRMMRARAAMTPPKMMSSSLTIPILCSIQTT